MIGLEIDGGDAVHSRAILLTDRVTLRREELASREIAREIGDKGGDDELHRIADIAVDSVGDRGAGRYDAAKLMRLLNPDEIDASEPNGAAKTPLVHIVVCRHR